jgi:hypothetical protein
MYFVEPASQSSGMPDDGLESAPFSCFDCSWNDFNSESLMVQM